MKLHLNSTGRGKGIGAYLGPDYQNLQNITNRSYQISSYFSFSHERFVVNIYRSLDANTADFLKSLCDVLASTNTIKTREILIVGDFNICYLNEKKHKIIQFLLDLGYTQLVTYPTHELGRLLDHVYVKSDNSYFRIVQQCIPALDHDVMHIIKMEKE